MAHDASPKGLSIAFEGHFDRVNALVILADGRVASATFWRDISIWNSKNGSLDASLEGHNDIVTNLTLLLDKRLASASNDGTIRIWSIGSTWTRCDQVVDAKSNMFVVSFP
jgi:WD40 repeat protein